MSYQVGCPSVGEADTVRKLDDEIKAKTLDELHIEMFVRFYQMAVDRKEPDPLESAFRELKTFAAAVHASGLASVKH